LHCVYRERAGISLYDALHESTPDAKAFHFPKHTIVEVARTLGRFKAICDGYGVRKEHISVFATEAMRTAKNREEMLCAIKQSSGLTVDILSPGMESLFGAMGARSGFTHVNGLFMDLGGGSVQMTYVDSSSAGNYDVLAAEAATSMPCGAAKLTAALRTQDTADAAKTELRTSIKTAYISLCQKFPQLQEQAESHDGITIYFCGGGFRGYGSMLMHTDPIQPYPIPAIGGYTAPGHRFIKWREMLHANNYEDGKIHGMSKRRREQFPAIATVVQSLVEAIPKIKEVTFCSGGNREGVLYMKLPASTREEDPIFLLPGGVLSQDPKVVEAAAICLKSALPQGYPEILSLELLHYIFRNAWQDAGNRDDANAARALHNPISGHLAGLPGMTHEMRAVLALILCSRWANDLGPVDHRLQTDLQALIGAELSWWCDYVGKFARFLATAVPVFPESVQALHRAVNIRSCSSGHGLGKKEHKVGIKLNILVASKCGLPAMELEGIFGKVGKGLHLGWKVEADVMFDE
jgi:retrograde regulation protein 2